MILNKSFMLSPVMGGSMFRFKDHEDDYHSQLEIIFSFFKNFSLNEKRLFTWKNKLPAG
jgi:hypothetical protein